VVVVLAVMAVAVTGAAWTRSAMFRNLRLSRLIGGEGQARRP